MWNKNILINSWCFTGSTKLWTGIRWFDWSRFSLTEIDGKDWTDGVQIGTTIQESVNGLLSFIECAHRVISWSPHPSTLWVVYCTRTTGGTYKGCVPRHSLIFSIPVAIELFTGISPKGDSGHVLSLPILSLLDTVQDKIDTKTQVLAGD